MAERFENIFLQNTTNQVSYTSPQQNGPRFRFPLRDAMEHGRRIQQQLEEAWELHQGELERRQAVSISAHDGVYFCFESLPGFELKIQSLEDLRSGIRLLNVKTYEDDGVVLQRATVYVPHNKRTHFLEKARNYAETGQRNQKLMASIEAVHLAVLESFWQDDISWMPGATPAWCEIWLASEQTEVLAEFRLLAASIDIQLKNEHLCFPERIVVLAFVTNTHLLELIQRSPYIAEFRRAPETARFLIELSNTEQWEWVDNLLSRLHVQHDSETSVCVLDTGVNNKHALLQSLMEDSDCQAYDPDWGGYDADGHGTEMAGIAAYGDLQKAIEDTGVVTLSHRLESVKILPNSGDNAPELYGAITSQSISKAEIQRPEFKRVLCMAVTATKFSSKDGRPDSWSGAIDEIASGYLDGGKRLFFISAGNVRDHADYLNYPISNQSCCIENPGQAWNAVTVGAYTEKVTISDPNYREATTVAPYRGLSPFSTTSCCWDQKKWPIKPEILLEGGNLLRDSLGCAACDDLSLLSTHYKPMERQFSCSGQTSAATAKAAWMAAHLQELYPNAWPETIRGLLIHSANWTSKMKEQFLPPNPNKEHYHQLLRTCGYGVPDIDRACWCIQNSVNLVIQEELQPFERDNVSGRYVTKDMNIHQIPWPKDVLLDLGALPVKMRVTLSYFIEPSPGEIGWKERYRYASCGLRFDVNSVNEELANFNRRLNAAAREDIEFDNDSGSGRWLIGKNIRHRGSIHSDIWEGTAANLATSNLIGIYPAIGWWRERHHLGRWNHTIRYALIVSLSTEAETVDLYTPIMALIRTRVPISVSTEFGER